jgi:hypothetical protein
MILPFIIIAVCLLLISFIVLYLLVGRIINQEKTIFEMNSRLTFSHNDYVDLLDLNIKLCEELESFNENPPKEIWYNEDDTSLRMNIIGQNGNDGLHYEN